MPEDAPHWIDALRGLHLQMLAALRTSVTPAAERATVTVVRGGDAIYQIDADVEAVLIAACEEWAREGPLVLVAEGISESGERVFPDGAQAEEAAFRLIVDPIDGTRGLMYDKRNAWVLSAVAPNWGPATRLRDTVCAVMTELPTSRARYADQLWALRGGGAEGVTLDLVPEPPVGVRPAAIAPSAATDLRHGYASLVKFFPGGKELTARLEEALFAELLGTPEDGTPLLFDDQYASSGGQLHELLCGRDRFIADLRPLILPRACAGESVGRLCAHPYDLCTALIAEEAGVAVTDADGNPLDAPLSVHDNVAWIGYANPTLQAQIEPVLQRLLREYGLR